METKIKIKNSSDLCVIDIEGIIGLDEQSQFSPNSSSVATYEKFRQSVAQIEKIDAPEVVVNIRSTGGDVNDALLIHDALCGLGGEVTTRCYGYTASAATIIAQAASPSRRFISPSALYLIHNSICVIEGNATHIAQQVALLEKTDERLAELYAVRAGGAVEQFAQLMAENNGNGRWLSPQEVIEYNLADAIIEEGSSGGESASGGEGSESKIVQAIAKMLRSMGLKSAPENVEVDAVPQNVDVNVTRTSGGDLFPHVAPAAEPTKSVNHELYEVVSATSTIPVQDPPVSDMITTQNQKAYEDDAKCFR